MALTEMIEKGAAALAREGRKERELPLVQIGVGRSKNTYCEFAAPIQGAPEGNFYCTNPDKDCKHRINFCMEVSDLCTNPVGRYDPIVVPQQPRILALVYLSPQPRYLQ